MVFFFPPPCAGSMGSAAKRRLYTLDSSATSAVGGEGNGVLNLSSLAPIPSVVSASRAPVELYSANEGGGEGSTGKVGVAVLQVRVGGGGAQQLQDGNGASMLHLDAVKRLNAMLSQLDGKDRDALKQRASLLS